MSNSNITRLVVGDRMTISMGVPVGQGVQESDISKTLRWREGRWESGAGFLNQAKQKLTTHKESIIKIPLKPTENIVSNVKNVALIASSLALIGLLAWAIGTYMSGGMQDKMPAAQALPFGAKPANTVKLVDEPFPIPGTDPALPTESVPVGDNAKDTEPAPGVIIPEVRSVENKEITALPLSAPKLEPTPVQVRAVPKAESKLPTSDIKGGKADDKDQKPVAHAVVLDVGPEAKSTATTTPPPAKSQPAPAPAMAMPIEVKPSVIAKPVTSATAATAQGAKSGNGLVAVSPDGRFALFTNQKTRLPEKFAVGEKLPSGEVIKSIDTSAGKVTTDSKEYRLE